jgi:hypothetical protein
VALIAAISTLVLAPPSFSEQVDRTIRVVSTLKAVNVKIAVDSDDGNRKQKGTYSLSFTSPAEANYSTSEPPQNGLDQIARSFAIRGQSLIGYDRATRELIRRQSPTSGSLAFRLTTVLGPLPDPVQLFAEPKYAASFFSPFKGLKGWKMVQSGGQPAWVLNQKDKAGRAARTEFRFTKGNFPTFVKVNLPGRKLEWKLTYYPAPNKLATPSFPNPRPTEAFVERLTPPRYLDATAQRLCKSSILFFDQLTTAEMQVKDADGLTTIAVSTNGLAQSNARARWGFDGTTLTVLEPRGRVAYKGSCSRLSVVARLDALGLELHPLTRRFLMRENPMRSLLTPDMKLKTVGSMRIGGQDLVMVSATGAQWKGSLMFRKADSRWMQLLVTTMTSKGQTTSRQELIYKSTGKPISASLLAPSVPAGWPVRPLPRG